MNERNGRGGRGRYEEEKWRRRERRGGEGVRS